MGVRCLLSEPSRARFPHWRRPSRAARAAGRARAPSAMFRNGPLPPGLTSVFEGVTRRQWDARRRREPHVGHPWLMRGLRLTAALEKHAGCVNAVSWNDDASLLLSGSDDLCVCVWSLGTEFPCRGSVYTGHVHNIFSAEFVPNSGSNVCVTVAGDGDVRRVDLARGFAAGADRNRPRRRWLSDPDGDSPHAVSLFRGDGREGDDADLPSDAGMGMKLRFVPGSAHVFLTTHQDGRVRRFDLRLPNANHTIVCDLSVQGSCSDIAFDPTNTSLFAVGCDDPYVRVFDVRQCDKGRRARAARARASSPSEREHPALLPVVAKYSPGRGAGFNTKRLQFDGVSGLAYSRKGELAVNYRGEHLYVIDRYAAEREYKRLAETASFRDEGDGANGFGANRGTADCLLDGWAMDFENAQHLAWTSRWASSSFSARGGGGTVDAPTALHPSRSPSPEFGYDVPSDDEDDEDDEDSDEVRVDDEDDARSRLGPHSDRRSASVPRDRAVSRGRSATPAAGADGANADPWSLFDADPTLRFDPSVRRFVGHKNVKTFLKGVAFLCDDAYVAVGGDCGSLFVWRKKTGALVQKVQADSQVVNNVCPHPRLPVAVTSGIDDVLRVWEPGEGADLCQKPTRETEDEDELAEAMLAELERGGHFAEVWDRLARRGPGDADDDEDDERVAADFDRWTRRGRGVDEESEETPEDEDVDDDEESSSEESSSESSSECSERDDAEEASDASDAPSGPVPSRIKRIANETTRAVGELARAEAREEAARRRRRDESPRRGPDEAAFVDAHRAGTSAARGAGASGHASGRAEEAAPGPSGDDRGLRRSKRVRASARGAR